MAKLILYMVMEYELPISVESLEILKKWNREDSPSSQEKVRNNRTEKSRAHTACPYLDVPALVDDYRIVRGL